MAAKTPKKQSRLTVAERTYLGSGTPTDPYIVDWDLNDPEDPYNWSKTKKWAITMQVCSLFPIIYSIFQRRPQLALCTWTVSFGSSSYSGGLKQTAQDLGISFEAAILGTALYVLGFALGYVILEKQARQSLMLFHSK